MAEPHSHAHSDPHDHGHGHHAHAGPAAQEHVHVHAGKASPVHAAVEPRPSWLLHSAAQRLLGAALVCVALVTAMLWATSAQG
ncbi:MAG: hypothetical protein RLZZ22_1265 [Pseudomonadota bacterium]|jgi:hypothetical protein